MHTRQSFRQVLLTLLATAIIAATPWHALPAIAADLTSPSVVLSNRLVNAESVSYTASFTAATTSNVKRVDFRFSTVKDGTDKPDGMDLSGADLGQVNNLGSNWDLDASGAASGLLSIARPEAEEVASGSAALVVLENITNPSLGGCDPNTPSLSDTCHISITTYSDDGSTEVDAVSTSFSVMENPSLSFEVVGVASGQTANGLTTNVSTTSTSLPFGFIESGGVKYAAHQLHISTNAPNGYKIRAYLDAPITGSDARNEVSPFGATDATWNTPQAWMTPTGSSRGTNAGWIGANTTDERISGWQSATAKFGPISTVPHIIAQSSEPDREGSVITITYALGTSIFQASDSYGAEVIYEVEAIY